jgi:hypothetical protein
VAANGEATRAREGLAEDQASAVVERLEYLGVELLEAAALAARLGVGAFRRPTSGGSLANDAVEPAARDELRVLWCIAHWRSPFLGLLTF